MQSDEEDNEAQGKDVMVTDPMDFHLDILDAKIHMLVSRVGLGILSFLHSFVDWFGVLYDLLNTS